MSMRSGFWRAAGAGALLAIAPLVGCSDDDEDGAPAGPPGAPPPAAGAGEIRFVSLAATGSESAASAEVRVARVGGTRGRVSIFWAAHPGSADPSDYAFDPSAPHEIVWADGEGGEKPIAVPLVNDALPEGDEHFFVFLGSPSGGVTIGGPDGATVTIQDDDAGPGGAFQFRLSRHFVDERAGQVPVEISRSGGAAGAATVNVRLQDHTTTPPDTSFVSPLTVAFADGEVSKTIAVEIVNDPIREGEEHFTLHLESPSPGSFVGTQSQTRVDILDNDDPGTIGFLVDAVSVHEGAATLSLIVRRTGGTQGAVTVEFSGVDGTALAGSDYSVTPGTLRWEDGHWGDRTITVTLFADAVPEGSETFDVVLSPPTGGAVLGTASLRVTVTE
jgi:hypothetical protein